MAANRKTDSDHVVVVPHTPREDAVRRGYETWLREVDNPTFNHMPGVVHAATGERTMFRLSPTTTTTDGDGP